jgi:hypothetical protein
VQIVVAGTKGNVSARTQYGCAKPVRMTINLDGHHNKRDKRWCAIPNQEMPVQSTWSVKSSGPWFTVNGKYSESVPRPEPVNVHGVCSIPCPSHIPALSLEDPCEERTILAEGESRDGLVNKDGHQVSTSVSLPTLLILTSFTRHDRRKTPCRKSHRSSPLRVPVMPKKLLRHLSSA